MGSEKMFKYNRSMYEHKIKELDGYKNQLKAHYDNLTALRDRLPTVWRDDRGKKAYNNIISMMDMITKAEGRIDELNRDFNDIIQDTNQMETAAGDVLDKATAALKAISGIG